jgi:hypothetical protein
MAKEVTGYRRYPVGMKEQVIWANGSRGERESPGWRRGD